MKNYGISLTVLLFSVAGVTFAHEFWLQPSHFFARPGDTINVQVLVGEGFQGERSEGKKNRIIQYRHDSPTGPTDLRPAIGDTYGDVRLLLSAPGTHQFSFANTPKFLSMRADSFLLYLREDGLDDVVTARQQQGDTEKRSRELYQRCAKSLVQVGPSPTALPARSGGMILDIVPTQNPYTQSAGQVAEFQVLFNQKPLAGTLVRYWNRSPASQSSVPAHHEQQRSDAQGRVRFRLKSGQNMISLVRMIPYSDPKQADWISYWGSLTFGCR